MDDSSLFCIELCLNLPKELKQPWHFLLTSSLSVLFFFVGKVLKTWPINKNINVFSKSNLNFGAGTWSWNYLPTQIEQERQVIEGGRKVRQCLCSSSNLLVSYFKKIKFHRWVLTSKGFDGLALIFYNSLKRREKKKREEWTTFVFPWQIM